MPVFSNDDVTIQSRRALAKMIDSRGPEPLRDMLSEILGVLAAGHDVTISSPTIEARLEYLRGEIRAERISYGEMAELQGLAEYIDPGDVELLEPAGVPEFPREGCADCETGRPVSHTHDD